MKRHSLLFGVQDYPGTGSLTPLRAPAADVDALAEVVGDARYMGEVGKVRPYKDLRLGDAREKFGEFFDGIDPEDVVLIYFSGHGLRDGDAVGHLYLCFTDTDEGKLDLTAQRATEIGEWLDRRGFKRTLIVLDCCYSGAAGAQLTKGNITAQLQAMEVPQAGGTGRYVLSSSGSATVSKEMKGAAKSVFTHHLIEGIRTGAADADGDGRISVAELSGYLSERVPKDAVGQLPELSSRKTSGTFVVAHNLRVIEERERARAAAAAAERARERAVLTGAVVGKLREHVQFGSMDMDFAGSVQAWLEAHPAEAAGHPRLALLREFSEGRLSAIKFHERWRAAAAHPAAAPEPPPQPPPWPPHVEPLRAAPERPAAFVEPEPARPAAAAADKVPPERPPAPAPPSPVEAAGRRVARGFWWRVGLVGGCYFAAAWVWPLIGLYSLAAVTLPGGIAGVAAWWLFAGRRWRGFAMSLPVVMVANFAFTVTAYYGGDLGYYLGELSNYPEGHVIRLIAALSGFLGAWLFLGLFRRAFRRRRAA